MKKASAIILNLLLIFLLNSCSNDEDTNDKIPEGLIVEINGKTTTFETQTTERVKNEGTINEYTELTIIGSIENSNERIFISLNKGKTGSDAIHKLLYINSKKEDHHYDSQDEKEYNFTSNTLINSSEKKLEGSFSGKLLASNKETSTELKGTFNIQY
ncbi:hypothetical protein J2Y38_001064 [Flavobacterium sp. 2755]|uniref:hypothetical protein n=1 Tax=Flavobacterium TaxID=237 RepID=UPI00211399AE|nr:MULTISPECIES: hypothetical protein [Flavobacterium]MDR6760866.1 hypothetical protein [Flavobacterium sp. 2755]UUF15807.1 hypothetical protein NLJ00_06725 [Flavobacterium panici]